MTQAKVCEATAGPAEILSTPDQIAQEAFAEEVFGQDAMRTAVAGLEGVAASHPQWAIEAGAATWRRSMSEFAFAFVLKTLNLEADRPQVLWDQNVPVRRGGRSVTGSRQYGNNPDNIYRRIPVDSAGRYVIRGKLREPHAADVNFSVLPSFTIEHGWKQVSRDAARLERDADGAFEVTLDAGPGNGSPNHMQLAPGAERLTVRDSMSDWAREVPMQLEVIRLDRADQAPARLDAEAVAAQLAPRLHAYVDHHLKFNDRAIHPLAANRLSDPVVGPSGGLPSQLNCIGQFDLQDDQAMIVEVARHGAPYLSLQLWDPWMFALEYRTQTGSLNDDQAVADEDGRYRFVISKHDPGVHNWIDTDGLLQGAVCMRWQGLPPGLSPDLKWISTRLAPISRLKAELPGDTRWLNSAQRREQLEHRRATHDRRFTI